MLTPNVLDLILTTWVAYVNQTPLVCLSKLNRDKKINLEIQHVTGMNHESVQNEKQNKKWKHYSPNLENSSCIQLPTSSIQRSQVHEWCNSETNKLRVSKEAKSSQNLY